MIRSVFRYIGVLNIGLLLFFLLSDGVMISHAFYVIIDYFYPPDDFAMLYSLPNGRIPELYEGIIIIYFTIIIGLAMIFNSSFPFMQSIKLTIITTIIGLFLNIYYLLTVNSIIIELANISYYIFLIFYLLVLVFIIFSYFYWRESENEIEESKNTIKEMINQFPAIKINEIEQKLNLTNSAIVNLLKEMISTKEIEATLDLKSKMVIFDPNITSEDIERLMKKYIEWDYDSPKKL